MLSAQKKSEDGVARALCIPLLRFLGGTGSHRRSMLSYSGQGIQGVQLHAHFFGFDLSTRGGEQHRRYVGVDPPMPKLQFANLRQ